MRIKTRGEERDGHGGERRKNKEPLAVCLSLLSNAKEKKKTSTWAEVQLLATVWRFITPQWGGGGGAGGGREQKVEWRRRWELEKRH